MCYCYHWWVTSFLTFVLKSSFNTSWYRLLSQLLQIKLGEAKLIYCFTGQASQKDGSVGKKNENKSYILITKVRKLFVKLGKSWQKYENDKCKTQKWWIGWWNEKKSIQNWKIWKVNKNFQKTIDDSKRNENVDCQKSVLFYFDFSDFRVGRARKTTYQIGLALR